jgi:hypothetical protein
VKAQPEKVPWPGSSREILPDLAVVNKGEKVGEIMYEWENV